MRVLFFISAILLVTVSFVAAVAGAPTTDAVSPFTQCRTGYDLQKVSDIVSSAIKKIIDLPEQLVGTFIVPVFSCFSDN